MGDAGFFKGASAEQDSRFSDKQKKLLKAMKFPDEFNQKIDMKKVNLVVIRPWVAKRITELLGFEDEVVVEFLNGLLEEPNPDPKMMQINLTGFLEKNTQPFLLELWKLLLSAQESIGGIPTTFLEAKKEEMKKAKIESDRVTAEVLKKREADEAENRKMKQIRKREMQEADRRDEGQRSSRRSSRRDTSSSPSSRRRDRSYTPPARRRNRSLTPPSRERSRDHYRPSRRSYYEDDRSRRRERDRRFVHHQREKSRSKSKSRSRSYTPSRSRSRSRNRKRSKRESDRDRSRGQKGRVRSRTRSRSFDKRATNDRNKKRRPRSRSHATSSSSKSASEAKATLAVPEPVIEKALTPGFDRAHTPSFKSKWDEDEEMENAVEAQEVELEDPRELEAKLRVKAMESLKKRK